MERGIMSWSSLFNWARRIAYGNKIDEYDQHATPTPGTPYYDALCADYELAKSILEGTESLQEVKLKLDLTGRKFNSVYYASWGLESVQLKSKNENTQRFVDGSRKEILYLFREYAIDKDLDWAGNDIKPANSDSKFNVYTVSGLPF